MICAAKSCDNEGNGIKVSLMKDFTIPGSFLSDIRYARVEFCNGCFKDARHLGIKDLTDEEYKSSTIRADGSDGKDVKEQ